MNKSLSPFLVLVILIACNGNQGESGKALARIDGKNFTEGDLKVRLQIAGESRLEEVLQNSEERRKEFNRILRERLGDLSAQHAGYAKGDSLKRRFALFDQRVKTQYYFDTYLNERYGQPMKDIEDYYRAHTTQFTGDSGKIMPFAKVVTRVADSLVVSHANLDSFYQANSKDYVVKAYCDVSMIQTAKRKQAEAALKALQGGMKFGEAAAKFSTHASKSNQGRVGRVSKGEINYDIGAAMPFDSLFFTPETRLKPGQVSGPIPKDSNFILVRPDSCHDDVMPPLETVRVRVAADYLRAVKAQLNQNATAALKAKYKVRFISPTKPVTETEIQAYYEKNKSNYESPETYDLYDIETANKDKLLARFKAVKDLEAFKALASQVSENSWVKPQGGHLGLVKRNFSLPYGIGMLSALFPVLDSVNPGKVETPLQSNDTQKWHFFWLAQKNPRQTKPLDRVHTLVRQDLEANRITTISPEDSLATTSNGHLLRERDVAFLRLEVPPNMRERYTRENLLDYLVTWQLASDEIDALGLDKEPKLIGSRLENEDSYWNKVYSDSVLDRTFDEDTTLLAKTFREKHDAFTKDTSDQDWHRHVHEIAGYLCLKPKDFDLEYRTNPEKYGADTSHAAMAKAGFDLFQSLKDVAFQRADDKELAKLKKRFHVRILDTALEDPTFEPAAAYYKKAQNLHYDRRLDQALDLYQKLRDRFPEQKGLQDSICFGIAQIYVEQERYQQAMAEYRRINYLYPGSADDYKAMFMIGFIYSEHLKNDSAAVHAFEQMLAKYPKTDLSDDADWMIRNIRSGGKLMPKLEGDSGWVAPDSGKAKQVVPKQKAAAPAKAK